MVQEKGMLVQYDQLLMAVHAKLPYKDICVTFMQKHRNMTEGEGYIETSSIYCISNEYTEL